MVRAEAAREQAVTNEVEALCCYCKQRLATDEDVQEAQALYKQGSQKSEQRDVQ
jgi:hypothetical protein